jgi:zinc D-Ala-D-Ala carboxypeptidase
MSHPRASRPTRTGLRSTAVNLAIATAAIICALVYQSASSSASSMGERPPAGGPRSLLPSARPLEPAISVIPRAAPGGATTGGRGVVSEADGALPDGVTVFDDEYSGVAKLHPDLRRALRDAAMDAADDGIELQVNSGWRSPAYQDQLFREAVSEYGSRHEAARWVATADTSAHVSGAAVDIGPMHAAAWLSEHGARHGLCQVYRNEPWHFELRPRAPDRGCPPMYADSAQDPDRQP